MKKKDSFGKYGQKNPEAKEAGGIYNFETKESAEKYVEMHTKEIS